MIYTSAALPIAPMNTRTRDALLLIAGLPGIIALFMPVGVSMDIIPIKYYWDELRATDPLLFHLWGIDWAVALPVVVVLFQTRRLHSAKEMNRLWLWALRTFTAVLQVGIAVFAIDGLLSVKWSLPRGWAEYGPADLRFLLPPLVVTAGNCWLLRRNWRARRPLMTTAEVFLLGTYVAVQSLWLSTGLLGEPVIGPKLMLWTCIAYAVTIAIRVHESRRIGGARLHPE